VRELRGPACWPLLICRVRMSILLLYPQAHHDAHVRPARLAHHIPACVGRCRLSPKPRCSHQQQNYNACCADGALIVTTPQDVAIIDVRKEVNFCRKTSLPVLGVVENMSGLQLPLAKLTFRSPEGKDVSAELAQCIPEHLRSAVACCDVFSASKGGGEAMAKDMGVPFLGKVPLDPELSSAAEAGGSLQELKSAASFGAFNAIVDSAHCSLCHALRSLLADTMTTAHFVPESSLGQS
jgi:NUBPL iron-transfer P-loop NTPase